MDPHPSQQHAGPHHAVWQPGHNKQHQFLISGLLIRNDPIEKKIRTRILVHSTLAPIFRSVLTVFPPVWPDWQIIGLWATFQSFWQQLICPNLLHSQAIFVKVSKYFFVKSFLGNFYRHLVIFSLSHCMQGSRAIWTWRGGKQFGKFRNCAALFTSFPQRRLRAHVIAKNFVNFFSKLD